jgi:hypothetical protein
VLETGNWKLEIGLRMGRVQNTMGNAQNTMENAINYPVGV